MRGQMKDAKACGGFVLVFVLCEAWWLMDGWVRYGLKCYGLDHIFWTPNQILCHIFCWTCLLVILIVIDKPSLAMSTFCFVAHCCCWTFKLQPYQVFLQWIVSFAKSESILLAVVCCQGPWLQFLVALSIFKHRSQNTFTRQHRNIHAAKQRSKGEHL